VKIQEGFGATSRDNAFSFSSKSYHISRIIDSLFYCLDTAQFSGIAPDCYNCLLDITIIGKSVVDQKRPVANRAVNSDSNRWFRQDRCLPDGQ
jgi:hypothetical protein